MCYTGIDIFCSGIGKWGGIRGDAYIVKMPSYDLFYGLFLETYLNHFLENEDY